MAETGPELPTATCAAAVDPPPGVEPVVLFVLEQPATARAADVAKAIAAVRERRRCADMVTP
jgi:hypothetical protein